MKNGWHRKTLADLVVVASGQVDPTAKPFADMPHIGGDNIESHTGRFVGISTARQLGMTSGKYAFTKEDVLYSKIRPNLNKVAAPDFDGICSADMYPLRPIAGAACREFLVYMLRSEEFLTFAEKHSARTNIPKLNREALLAFETSVPPLSEQKRIAGILDQADGLRRKRQQALALTDQFLRSTFLDLFGDPVTNPKRWPMVTFEDIVSETKLGLVRGSRQIGDERAYPYVRMDAISDLGSLRLKPIKRVDATDEERAEFSLSRGDFLFNTRNSRELVGKTATFDGDGVYLFNNNIMRIRFRDTANPDYMNWLFQTSFIQRQLETRKSGTTSVYAIYQKSLLDVVIMLPPVDQQNQFATTRDQLRLTEAHLAAQTAAIDDLFNSLVQRAFRGDL